MHTSPSPSPRAGGRMYSAQGRGPESEGRSPAPGSGEPPLESSGTLHEESSGVQLKASPSPQPCPALAATRASPSPAARASAGPGAGPREDACTAYPHKASSPSQSGDVLSLGTALPLSGSRTSPAVQYRTFPSAEAGLSPTTHRLTPYVETGKFPAPHADQLQPQPAFQHRASPLPQANVRASPSLHGEQPQPPSAFQLRASPSLRDDVRASPSPHGEQPQPQSAFQFRASPSPHAEQSQPRTERPLRASPLPHADERASPSPHSERSLPQPAFQYKASPEQPRALPYGQNRMSSPVAQMMVLPSQLRLPPQLAAMTAGQVTCTLHPMLPFVKGVQVALVNCKTWNYSIEHACCCCSAPVASSSCRGCWCRLGQKVEQCQLPSSLTSQLLPLLYKSLTAGRQNHWWGHLHQEALLSGLAQAALVLMSRVMLHLSQPHWAWGAHPDGELGRNHP